MDIPLAVLADTAIAAADGKLSVIGIFSVIRAARFPAVHPQCALVLQLRATPGERGQQKRVLIRLMDEDSVLIELNSDFQVPEQFEDPRSPFIVHEVLQMQGLTFQRAGEYAFHVLVNEEEKAVVRFQVIQIAVPPPE